LVKLVILGCCLPAGLHGGGCAAVPPTARLPTIAATPHKSRGMPYAQMVSSSSLVIHLQRRLGSADRHDGRRSWCASRCGPAAWKLPPSASPLARVGAAVTGVGSRLKQAGGGPAPWGQTPAEVGDLSPAEVHAEQCWGLEHASCRLTSMPACVGFSVH
jgi:hypothetical protein